MLRYPIIDMIDIDTYPPIDPTDAYLPQTNTSRFWRPPREPLPERERLAAADPDDGDATAPGRGGDRGYGIARDHLNERKNFRISSAVLHATRRL